MKIALIAIAALFGLALVIVIIGYSLPVKHHAARQLTLLAAPDSVFSAISAPEKFPAWRPRVTSVDVIASPKGVPSYRENGADGPIRYEVDASVPPSRFVTRIADPSLPFGGRGHSSSPLQRTGRRCVLQRTAGCTTLSSASSPGSRWVIPRPSTHISRLSGSGSAWRAALPRRDIHQPLNTEKYRCDVPR